MVTRDLKLVASRQQLEQGIPDPGHIMYSNAISITVIIRFSPMALDLCSAGQPQPYIENLELSYQRTTRLYYHIQQYHHIFSYTLISCQLCIHSIRLSSHLIRVICFAHSISQFTALTSRQKYNMLYQKTCLQRSLRTYTCLSLPSITKMTHCTQ